MGNMGGTQEASHSNCHCMEFPFQTINIAMELRFLRPNCRLLCKIVD